MKTNQGGGWGSFPKAQLSLESSFRAGLPANGRVGGKSLCRPGRFNFTRTLSFDFVSRQSKF